ncbi:MAG: hypothetical protein WC841_00670 [Candidatus Shapirobacteria bacterium]|jgi:hypothetical protein
MAYPTEMLREAVKYLRVHTGRCYDDRGDEWPRYDDGPVVSTADSLARRLEELAAHPDNYSKPPIIQISTRPGFGSTAHSPQQAVESLRCAADVISSVLIVASLPIRRVQSSPQEINEGRSPYLIEVDLRELSITNP